MMILEKGAELVGAFAFFPVLADYWPLAAHCAKRRPRGLQAGELTSTLRFNAAGAQPSLRLVHLTLVCPRSERGGLLSAPSLDPIRARDHR